MNAFQSLRRFLYLFIAGHHKWSRCWMGLHRWDMPGGHCERCGKCDEYFGPHNHAAKQKDQP